MANTHLYHSTVLYSYSSDAKIRYDEDRVNFDIYNKYLNKLDECVRDNEVLIETDLLHQLKETIEMMRADYFQLGKYRLSEDYKNMNNSEIDNVMRTKESYIYAYRDELYKDVNDRVVIIQGQISNYFIPNLDENNIIENKN